MIQRAEEYCWDAYLFESTHVTPVARCIWIILWRATETHNETCVKVPRGGNSVHVKIAEPKVHRSPGMAAETLAHAASTSSGTSTWPINPFPFGPYPCASSLSLGISPCSNPRNRGKGHRPALGTPIPWNFRPRFRVSVFGSGF